MALATGPNNKEEAWFGIRERRIAHKNLGRNQKSINDLEDQGTGVCMNPLTRYSYYVAEKMSGSAEVLER